MHWYAIRTHSNCEKKVSSRLTEQGIQNYLPVFGEMRQWKDRKKLIESPVFPGYLFTRVADSRDYRLAVLRIEGIVCILGLGGTIEPIPDNEIEGLQMMLRTSSRCLAHPLVREGAWVRIRRGPLKDLEGLLTRVKNQTRLVVSIHLLSQSVSTEVAAEDVEFLSSRPEKRQIA